MAYLIDETGRVYSRLLVLGRGPNCKRGKARWLCFCECENTCTVFGHDLRRGHTQSCGCYQRERARDANITHGLIKMFPIEYHAWLNMKARCYNWKSDHYADYGGRGIQVCVRWRYSFETFLLDVGPRPTPEHSLERGDNSESYGPEHCYWATKVEQANNRRNNLKYRV